VENELSQIGHGSVMPFGNRADATVQCKYGWSVLAHHLIIWFENGVQLYTSV